MFPIAWSIVMSHVVALSPQPISMPTGYRLIAESSVSGTRAVVGNKVTANIKIQSKGKVLVDTAARGLPFTFIIGEHNSPQLLSDLALGLSPRSRREVYVTKEVMAVKAPTWEFLDSDCTVTISIVSVVK